MWWFLGICVPLLSRLLFGGGPLFGIGVAIFPWSECKRVVFMSPWCLCIIFILSFLPCIPHWERLYLLENWLQILKESFRLLWLWWGIWQHKYSIFKRCFQQQSIIPCALFLPCSPVVCPHLASHPDTFLFPIACQSFPKFKEIQNKGDSFYANIPNFFFLWKQKFLWH